MSSIPRRPPPSSKPGPQPHNPAVCGLFSELDCDQCRVAGERTTLPNASDAARERWQALLRDYHRLLRADGPRSWEMPPPLAGEALRCFAATLLSPGHRRLLRELLLDLLSDGITDIALAVAQEVNRGQ
jgi:hypothetical protein